MIFGTIFGSHTSVLYPLLTLFLIRHEIITHLFTLDLGLSINALFPKEVKAFKEVMARYVVKLCEALAQGSDTSLPPSMAFIPMYFQYPGQP